MNYVKIDSCDFNNGDGIRVTLWVSGCPLQCKGCHNSQLWDRNVGKEFTQKEMDKIIKLLNNDYIRGLSILGGEPLAPYNIKDVVKVMQEVRKHYTYQEKDIWLWTGYNENELNIPDEIDVIICGRYKEDKKVDSKYFGSSNQKMIIRREINED